MQVHQNKQVKTFGKELIAAFLAQTKETIALGEIHNARFKIPALWDYGCCDRCRLKLEQRPPSGTPRLYFRLLAKVNFSVE
jgi:hypothetical protein